MPQALGIGPVATAGSGGTRTITLNGVTVHHGIAVALCFDGSMPTITCTGEANLTPANATPFNPATFGGTDRLMIFRLDDVQAGGNKTLTITGFTSYCAGAGFSASGGNLPGWLDPGVEGGATGTATTATKSLTTSAANDLILAIAAADGSDPTALGSGYVGITIANPSNFANGEYNLDVGAAGAKSVQMTVTGGGAWGIYAAAFKLAGVATVSIPQRGEQVAQALRHF